MLTLENRFIRAVDFLKSPLGAAILAILGLLLAVYTGWFNDKRTEVSVALESRADLVAPSATLPSLSVLVDGVAIDPKKTPIEQLAVTLWNSGQTTIRQGDFDPSSPFGFAIKGGRILQVSLLKASNKYLNEAAKPISRSTGEVTLSPVILEPGDIITVGVVIQLDSGSTVSIVPIGKVAGAPEILERVVVWHPAGYPMGAQTRDEIQRRKYFSGFVLLLVGLNLLFVVALKALRWLQNRKLRGAA